MFEPGSSEPVWIDQGAGVGSGALHVTIGQERVRRQADPDAPAEVRLRFETWDLDWDLVDDLAEVLLAGHGVVPADATLSRAIFGDSVDVPLIEPEPESADGTAATWRITESLVLMHDDVRPAYFYLVPNGTGQEEDVHVPLEVLDGPPTVRLTAEQTWRAVQALTSLAMWQGDAPEEERSLLHSSRREPAVMPEQPCVVGVPVIQVRGGEITLDQDVTRADGTCLQFGVVCVDTELLPSLCTELLAGPGVLPEEVRAGPSGLVQVPLLEPDRAVRGRLEWRIGEALAVVHDSRPSVAFARVSQLCGLYPLDVSEHAATVVLTGAESWRLVRALSSILVLQRAAYEGFKEAWRLRYEELAAACSPQRPLQA